MRPLAVLPAPFPKAGLTKEQETLVKSAMQKLLAVTLLLACCTLSCSPKDSPDSRLDTTEVKVESGDLIPGRWRKTQGEEWWIIEFTRDGAYRHARFHDGAGGSEGVDREKGIYRVLGGNTLHIRLEG